MQYPAIKLTVAGAAELVGDNPIKAAAGTATILLKAGADKITITAAATGLKSITETLTSVQK